MLVFAGVPAVTPVLAAGSIDPVAGVILALAVVLVGAKLGGELAERLGQPAVLGELVAGMLLGNLNLVGVSWVNAIPADATIDVLAKLGAVLLLFEVGLESTVGDIMKVGGRAFIVATLGVVTPWVLGWGVGALFLPNSSGYVHAFLGATLTATSVGITARVLSDIGRGQSPEARVILGAAVIDDVMGLVILAGITSVIATAESGTGVSYLSLALVFGKALLFLVSALVAGRALSPRVFSFAGRLRGQGILLITALVLCFVLSYIASIVGLAPIVGAYAAGLVLEETHYTELAGRGGRSLQDLIRPIATFLVPVFFVVMGMRVRLETFANLDIMALAGVLTVAAIIGKQVCALGGIGASLNKLAIGIGMIPRGEVGLIFANLGLGLTLHGEHIVDQGIYSAVVIMVVATALITPPALAWSFRRTPMPVGAPAELVEEDRGTPHRFMWSSYRQAQPWLISRTGPRKDNDRRGPTAPGSMGGSGGARRAAG
jgi:Kef-type K+ transport system membrane component KefB